MPRISTRPAATLVRETLDRWIHRFGEEPVKRTLDAYFANRQQLQHLIEEEDLKLQDVLRPAAQSPDADQQGDGPAA